jgi:hypothetical protein
MGAGWALPVLVFIFRERYLFLGLGFRAEEFTVLACEQVSPKLQSWNLLGGSYVITKSVCPNVCSGHAGGVDGL